MKNKYFQYFNIKMETKFITEKITLKKVNRVHLELFSYTKKEMGEKKRKSIYNFSFWANNADDKSKIKNDKQERKEDEKEINNVRKLDETFISSDNEEEIENSSDISCEEEIIL